MNNPQQIKNLRSRKLGVLIYDARTAARRSIEECAGLLGIPVEQYQAYESGKQTLSLPDLETLAYYFDIPLEHFWSHQSLSENETQKKPGLELNTRLRQIRDRMIGARLRLLRNQANLTTHQIAERTGISEQQIKQFELGEVAIPLTDLEILVKALDTRLEDFFDSHGPIGNWRAQKQTVNKFMELVPEMQDFVCTPVNRPYLELAMRLSQLSVEKLRSIAEGLLEITY
ncbi:MAG TPA: helix-turn-helix transcriptional regulator [Anaerolineaceae bacterium]|nr:helix-turn-helix transcriptional regulator [Anaerolineaceae bacterium]